MPQLGSLRSRLTPGQQRRRAERIARRSHNARLEAYAPIKVERPPNAWNESHIQERLRKLRNGLSPVYGARYIRNQLNRLREHLIAIAKASRIERCTYQRVVRNARGEIVYAADECGGRIRQRRVVQNGKRGVERFCATCGREALA